MIVAAAVVLSTSSAITPVASTKASRVPEPSSREITEIGPVIAAASVVESELVSVESLLESLFPHAAKAAEAPNAKTNFESLLKVIYTFHLFFFLIHITIFQTITRLLYKMIVNI